MLAHLGRKRPLDLFSCVFQVMDYNIGLGKQLLPLVVQVLKYCTCPQLRHYFQQPPRCSLWALRPHIRQMWLKALLVILYKVVFHSSLPLFTFMFSLYEIISECSFVCILSLKRNHRGLSCFLYITVPLQRHGWQQSGPPSDSHHHQHTECSVPQLPSPRYGRASLQRQLQHESLQRERERLSKIKEKCNKRLFDFWNPASFSNKLETCNIFFKFRVDVKIRSFLRPDSKSPDLLFHKCCTHVNYFFQSQKKIVCLMSQMSTTRQPVLLIRSRRPSLLV